MKSLCNNQKERKTYFFITKAVNFFNEHPFICFISSFFRVTSTLAKTVDLYEIAG